MKTLDEVIKAYEICMSDGYECNGCPYADEMGEPKCCGDDKADALQWLKGYRGHIELDKIRDKCEAKNDPLTWDELKTMEGKPVWVEEEGCGLWAIVGKYEKTIYDTEYIDFIGYATLQRNNMGEYWKAYRKER